MCGYVVVLIGAVHWTIPQLAWPLTSPRPGVMTGGVGFGNVNVEAIQFPGQIDPRPRLLGFAFEPSALDEIGCDMAGVCELSEPARGDSDTTSSASLEIRRVSEAFWSIRAHSTRCRPLERRLDMRTACTHADHMSRMVQIRNVPEALHRKLKVRAADAGQTLSDYLLSELERLAARPTREEMLSRIHSRKRVTLKTPAAAVIREERESV